MEMFQMIGEQYLGLSPKAIQPFDGWSLDNSPDWWQCHNKLKHDWLHQAEKATLETTISGFAGTFLVFALCTKTRQVLVDTKCAKVEGNFATSEIKRKWGALEPLPAGPGLAAKSALFGYIFLTDPETLQLPSQVFGPDSLYEWK